MMRQREAGACGGDKRDYVLEGREGERNERVKNKKEDSARYQAAWTKQKDGAERKEKERLGGMHWPCPLSRSTTAKRKQKNNYQSLGVLFVFSASVFQGLILMPVPTN